MFFYILVLKAQQSVFFTLSYIFLLLINRPYNSFSIDFFVLEVFPLYNETGEDMRTAVFVFLLSLLFYVLAPVTHARLLDVKSSTVQARVGDYYLRISGRIAPFASVILSSDGTVYRTTVADSAGAFSFTDILIRRGFKSFCLQAIDVKRIGDSLTCFSIPPATGDLRIQNLFLPPTLGLQQAEINEDGDVLIFGYSLPHALVTVYLGQGKSLSGYTDANGYYQFTAKPLKAGEYEIYALAQYRGVSSEKPDSTKTLKVLSLQQQAQKQGRDLFRRAGETVGDFALNPLWLIIPLLIAIVVLVRKLWPEKFNYIAATLYQLYATITRKRKPLHHAWFVGY